MINFIIVDDMLFFREQMNNLVISFSIKSNIQTNIYLFEEYNKDFKKVSNLQLENKVYILDIETPKHNGIEEAKKIRNKDKNCIIIFLTSYESTYYPDLLRSQMEYNFISKQELFKTKLLNYFDIVANEIYSSKNSLAIEDYNALINIKYEDILYIYSENNKNIVKTTSSEISVNKSLNFLLSKLPKYFIKSHRSCIVNLKNIIYIKNEIIFFDGNKINLLSRTYKNIVMESYKNIHNINGD